MNRFVAVCLIITILIISSCGRESRLHIEENETPEWEGKAQLIQEAIIGVGQESEEYYLGRPVGIVAHGDHIYILDNQVPILRMYDLQGNHVRDIGRIGQGPGEYQMPWSLGINSVDGTLFIREAMGGTLHEYSREGDPLGLRRPALGGASVAPTLHLKVTNTGIPYIRVSKYRRDQESKTEGYQTNYMVSVDPSGSLIDTLFVPDYLDQSYLLVAHTPEGLPISERVPFSPEQIWTMSPSGILIHGISDSYHLQLVAQDGSEQTIHREVTPVEVLPNERRWYEQRIRDSFKRFDTGWRWNAKATPTYKPYFSFIFADQNGRIWILRQGIGRFKESEDIWQNMLNFEVFEENTGRYLGEVEVPDGIMLFPEPFVLDDTFFALFSEQDGASVVKRFRLVIPQ